MTPAGVVVLGALAIAALLVLSAFFSSSETAIFSLTDDWIRDRVTAGDPGADDLEGLRRDPHRLLVTILVGNNVVNVAISSIITVILVESLPAGIAITAATVLASVMVLVFGEIVPKSYGLGNAERWSLRVARPIRVIERGMSPVVTAFDGLTRRLTSVLGVAPEIERAYLDE